MNPSAPAARWRRLWQTIRNHPLARVGPGLITGAADDDPSGIATYSQAGAQYGLNMLWTMPLAYPLMAAIQAMCACIGRVTGRGLAANIRSAFPPAVLKVLAYAAVLFTVRVPWGEVALRTLWPHLRLDATAAAVVVGVFGTTISPYLFFWQASEEVEDMRVRRDAPPLLRDPAAAPGELRRIAWDTWTGMFYSDLTAYFIILATAVTLHVAGITDIETAAQAASALRPLAGEFAFLLFAVGILGVGLIGVPVLAASGAYALAESLDWDWGLERRLKDARGFYGVIAVGVLAGLGIQYLPISPMRALFWSAVINGVVAVPLMVVIILLASSRSVMGPFTVSRPIIVLGWIATAVMGAAAVRMFVPG